MVIKWDEANANQFFSMFGAGFKSTMSRRVKESEELRASVVAFLEVGNERNKLVHQDYATFSMEKTLDEIYELYQKATRLVDCLPTALRESDAQATLPAAAPEDVSPPP
jgi:hypothetical protein